MWNGIKDLIENLPLEVALNVFLGLYALRTSVNLSCDHEIVFQDSQQSYLKWE